VAFRISDRFGAGAGLLYSFGSWDQRRAVAAGNDYGELSLSGNGTAVGFMAGLYYAFDEDLHFGLTYRSAQTLGISDGSFGYTALPASLASEYPASGSYDADLKLPSSVTGAVAYRFTDELQTTFELGYAGWSRLDSVAYTSTDSSFGMTRRFELDDALSGRVGAAYAFSDRFTLRGGFAYGISPFDDSHVMPEVPDANKILFTVGATFTIHETFRVDLGAGMENYFERQGSDSASGLVGTYKTIRYLGGLSLNLSF
jgi:long-chain fatty acid transport protein